MLAARRRHIGCKPVLVQRFLSHVVVIAGFVVASASATAHAAALLAASDASRIEELEVAKVMAQDSSYWLSVRLRGKTQLALVTGASEVEPAPAADPWLRALEFTTRVRVAAPLGFTSNCASSEQRALVDTGLPDPLSLGAERVETVGSELELRRLLQDAGLQVEPERVARFASNTASPFRIYLYDAPEQDAATAAIRIHDVEGGGSGPQLEVAHRDGVPLTLLAVASTSVLPPTGSGADASEFPVTYRSSSSSSTNASTDYLAARGNWLLEHPQRWLVEAQNEPSLFAWSVLAPSDSLAPAVARYLQGLAGSCSASVYSAHDRHSQQAAEYTCGDHDDLALTLTQLGFAEPRLTRLFGLYGADGVALHTADSAPRSPLVNATDVEAGYCPPIDMMPTPGTGTSTPDPNPPVVVVSDPGPSGYSTTDPGTAIYTDDGGCNLAIFDSETCTGHPSSSDSSSSDSCTGDSSSDGASDSCSGDSSSSDSSSSDSCSGESDSSGDSDGCGKSDGYDGDTCTGNSRGSAETPQMSSAPLRSDGVARNHRPRRVHLSLLTLLFAALVLPLRRLRL